MFDGPLPEALRRSCRPGEYFNLEARFAGDPLQIQHERSCAQFMVVVGGNRGRCLNLHCSNALPVSPVTNTRAEGAARASVSLDPPFCKSEL